MYRKLITQAAIFGLLLLAFDTLARKMYWYFRIPRIDTVAHTIGGIFTAILISALLYKIGKSFSKRKTVLLAVLLSMIVGVVWEYYEYFIYIITQQRQFIDVANSISDIICDTIGIVLGVTLVIIENKRYNRVNG